MIIEAAARAFADPFVLKVQDHTENRERGWQTLGMAGEHILLLVAQSADEDEDGKEVFGISSARKADRQETQRYEPNG